MVGLRRRPGDVGDMPEDDIFALKLEYCVSEGS